MLKELYFLCKPWAKANYFQRLINRVLGRVANYAYPVSCSSSNNNRDYKMNCEDTVVSLTSFPARINKVHLCIESILRQDVRPEHVILWLAEEQFPDKKLPLRLEKLKEHGLEIRFCKDYRSYKKIFGTINLYPQKNIVIADDDTLYPEDWLRNMTLVANEFPKCVVCYRARKILLGLDNKPTSSREWDNLSKDMRGPSFLLFAVGVGGVLYPKGFFAGEKIDFDRIFSIAPTSDDYWLKALSLKRGYKTVKVHKNSTEWFTILGSQKTTLTSHNLQFGQDDIWTNLLSYYGVNLSELL